MNSRPHREGAERHCWTKRQIAVLRREYPHKATKLIAAKLGLPLANVYAKANHMGLRKSAKFLATDASGRIFKGGQLGKLTQFKPGQPAWNKGKHYDAGGRSAETRFKKGSLSGRAKQLIQPVGAYRVNGDGYLDRKVNQGPVIHKRWVAVHRLVWIEAHGPIPPGHIVCFKPGRFSTDLAKITPDALECISRREIARRNVMWNRYPPELARAIQLRGALNRQINRRAA